MKNCTAIICEYNPFHNGHLYQLNKVREKSDIVMCIMSGNTVQRGGFSCANKYERARIAIDSGADIVVEHPFPHCMSSAADFASSGVYIAKALGAEKLAFGHESSPDILMKIFKVLTEDSVDEKIKSIYKNDKRLSYPKAREAYVEDILGSDISVALRHPNNILAIEYLLSLKEYKNISPLFIERNQNYISAGEIRRLFLKSVEDFDILSSVPFLPQKLVLPDEYDIPVISYLNLSNSYSEIYDCDYSLYNRLISFSKKSKNVDELVRLATTSAYTSSKVRRAIFSVLFNVKTENVKDKISYTILLGASKKGIEYISDNNKRFSIPVLTRKTDEKKNNADTTLLFKVDRMFSLISKESFTPYKKPYIK